MPEQMRQVHVGGSFAPPLDDVSLARYESMATALPESHVKDGMLSLVKMMKEFRKTPASSLPPKMHPATRTLIVTPLEAAEIKRIWDVVPWPEECDTLGRVFDEIQPGDLRNAAYHLLWYARELCNDREPITSNLL